ncbi:MAG: hypothetical protein GAK34_01516 [Delftia tsuruhatensis]|nr:MAG: hypothetical protein GAK34_01516 [Delftia tsuruhatensis]
MGVAELGRVAGLEQGLHAVVAGDHQAAVVQGHLHMAAAPAALALVERGQDGLGRVHAREHVHGGHAELQRALALLAVHGHDAGLALHHQVVAGPRGLGAAARVARDGAVHQARVQLRQLLVAQPQLLGAADLEVLDDHVAVGRQLACDAQALFGLQVQRDRALVAVGAVEVGGVALAHAHAPVARVVAAARVLDLDDLGTQVGQRHGTHGAGQHARKIQDAHAVQRQGRGESTHAKPCRTTKTATGR